MVISHVEQIDLKKSEYITKTVRGRGGFGSTGI